MSERPDVWDVCECAAGTTLSVFFCFFLFSFFPFFFSFSFLSAFCFRALDMYEYLKERGCLVRGR